MPFKLRPERMDADLALLAKSFECIRTYSMTGLEALPDLARKHGLKLMIGAWVNSNPVDTAKEVDLLIASANANADVVTSVIVGNETLLRKEVTGAQLAKLINKVKSQVKQPVTYADVWEFWLKHPEIAPAVDFLTIHLLPYWEDDPSNIDAALQHVAEVRQVFGNKFAPKDVMIGETGWPSEGRQRETALPSRVNEAKFIRGFVDHGRAARLALQPDRSLRPAVETRQRRCGRWLLGAVRCRSPGQGRAGRVRCRTCRTGRSGWRWVA